MLPKAIFLDKDGTLIENVPYNVDPKKIQLTNGALDGLKTLHNAGFILIIVTNQAGVAYGRFTESDLVPVHERIKKLLDRSGIPLAGFYYCPHHPDGKVEAYRMTCFCRKPSPGLLFQAAREHNINLAASWVIGDILNDMEAGRRADCRTILINNGNETEWKLTSNRRPHYTVKNLYEGAQLILKEESRVLQPVYIPQNRLNSYLGMSGR